MRRGAPILLGFLTLGSCKETSPEIVVPQPTNLTLENALVSVVESFKKARERSTGMDQDVGLNPCRVTIVFNVSAGGKSGSELVLDANAKGGAAAVIASAGAKYSNTDELRAERGNQITVEMTSPACNPAGTLGTEKPEKVYEMADQASRLREQRKQRMGDGDTGFGDRGPSITNRQSGE